MNRQVFDLTGKKFGRLTVQSFDKSEKGNARWNCTCECGNEVSVLAMSLKSGDTQSCGCLALESSKLAAEKNLHNDSVKKKALENREKSDRQNGIYVSALKRKRAVNNKSGVKGVFWDKTRQRWRATITLDGKMKWLGTFIHIEDAIEARKKAEEIYFAPILKKYDKVKVGVELENYMIEYLKQLEIDIENLKQVNFDSDGNFLNSENQFERFESFASINDLNTWLKKDYMEWVKENYNSVYVDPHLRKEIETSTITFLDLINQIN